MKRKILVGNWKMNKTIAETIDFVAKINERALEVASEEVIIGIAPSFICLPVLRKLGTGIISFAQNVHFADKGAYTGEVSPLMLKEIGVNASLVGHSERRKHFAETNEVCNQKLQALEKHNFNAIYCIGETVEERQQGLSKEVIKKQVLEGIEGLSKEYISNLTIAYEPIWSISTSGIGENATIEIASEACKYVNEVISEKYGEEVGDSVYVLYGGSVNPDNIKEYVNDENIDGVLVGGASLTAESFLGMINNMLD